ncbi:MAG: aspartate-semialdehyde dehydrogenase [Clostridia bacterium]|nr:aspartate-semialdehyde dehydrogenase [Clostridia bacterium]
MNIAVVGATGMVGEKFIQVLQERNIKADNYYLYASSKSAGKTIKMFNKDHIVIELSEENIKDKKIDYALFSAGGSISKEYAPIFAKYGTIVIDNSSAWRQDKNVPLVVPEVNPEDILWNNGIIANPNCSTIQAILPLKAIDDKFKIKRIVYSTYQAVSGAGKKGYDDLKNGINGEAPKKFVHPIFSNVLPHIDDFLDNGYTKEEEKMIFETRKILHNQNLKITATTVRVPVFNCHSESINIETEKSFELQEVFKTLADFKNIVVMDDPKNNIYPIASIVNNHDEVYVGRIRRDFSVDNGLNIWVVADNIRKGAATNAVQILEKILEYKKEGKM